MARTLKNYIRLRRRERAITQKELAFLLGYRSDTSVARFEQHGRRITLSVAFGCELIFGVDSARELFPDLFKQVEDGVVRRMYELHGELSHRAPSRTSSIKLRALKKALARATGESIDARV